MSSVSRSLRTVARGLLLVYAALWISVLAQVSGFLLTGLLGSKEGGGGKLLLILPAVLIGLAAMLDTIGRLLCLAMPREISGVRYYIYGSVLFSLAALAANGYLIASMLAGQQPTPVVTNLGSILGAVGSLLFLLFLASLADCVEQPELASRALLVLVLVIAMGGLLALMAFGAGVMGLVLLLLGCAAVVILPLVLLYLYGSLLFNLWDAVAQRARYLEPSK
jgi:hypothetical protein